MNNLNYYKLEHLLLRLKFLLFGIARQRIEIHEMSARDRRNCNFNLLTTNV